jgi:hypothetical protein
MAWLVTRRPILKGMSSPSGFETYPQKHEHREQGGLKGMSCPSGFETVSLDQKGFLKSMSKRHVLPVGV